MFLNALSIIGSYKSDVVLFSSLSKLIENLLALDQVQEFFTCFGIISEDSKHS